MTAGDGTTSVGIISDTHGLLRAQAVDALRGADLVLHAGDIGGPEIIASLENIAPVTAVRGNNDREAWSDHIAEREVIEIAGVKIFMLHDLKELDVDPAGFDVIVAGHSHKPKIEARDGVLFVNPGSAGPRRFSLPVSIARLTVREGQAEARIVELDVAPPKRKGKA